MSSSLQTRRWRAKISFSTEHRLFSLVDCIFLWLPQNTQLWKLDSEFVFNQLENFPLNRLQALKKSWEMAHRKCSGLPGKCAQEAPGDAWVETHKSGTSCGNLQRANPPPADVTGIHSRIPLVLIPWGWKGNWDARILPESNSQARVSKQSRAKIRLI